MKNISRRRFTQTCIAMAVGATGMAMPRAFQEEEWWHRWNLKPDPEAEGLTAYFNHGSLFVRYNNLPLLNYRAYSGLKYPYFTPLNGPVSGLSLTTESALPYPHHRGLWLGCEPLEGGDFWGDSPLSRGQIRSIDPQLHESGKEGFVRFTDKCEWVREGTPSPFEDRRTFRIEVPSEQVRILDCHFIIQALTDIHIEKAKHAFFAMRCAPDIAPTYGGNLVNSEGGVGARGTYGKPARWCSYFGARAQRPDVVEGITLMNHPSNFGGDCPWLTRDYGHMTPQPFNFQDAPFRMAPGDSFELRYRIVLHAGSPEQANVEALYKEWA